MEEGEALRAAYPAEQERHLLESFEMRDPPEGVYAAAAAAIRMQCQPPKLLMEALRDVRNDLLREFRAPAAPDMDEKRATLIAAALLMKAVYDGAAYISKTEEERERRFPFFDRGKRPVIGLNTNTFELDLAHYSGWRQDRNRRYLDLLDGEELDRGLGPLLFSLARPASFKELTGHLRDYAFVLVRRAIPPTWPAAEGPPDRPLQMQDVFVSTLHAMFSGIVHKKIRTRVEGQQGELRTICYLTRTSRMAFSVSRAVATAVSSTRALRQREDMRVSSEIAAAAAAAEEAAAEQEEEALAAEEAAREEGEEMEVGAAAVAPLPLPLPLLREEQEASTEEEEEEAEAMNVEGE